MNYYFISAGIFLFITFLIHVIAGNKEFLQLNPKKQGLHSDKLHGIWLMGICGFQMVSLDLLLTSVFTFLIGMNIIPFNFYLALFIGTLYVGYLTFWLLTLFLLKAKRSDFLREGQWTLFLVASILIALGINSAL